MPSSSSAPPASPSRSSAHAPVPADGTALDVDRGPTPLPPHRIPVTPHAVQEVSDMIAERRASMDTQASQHALMLERVRQNFIDLFGQPMDVQVGNTRMLDSQRDAATVDGRKSNGRDESDEIDGRDPLGMAPDAGESADLDETVWGERVRTDAAARVPTEAQRRAGVPDRRWFVVQVAQRAMGQGIPHLENLSLDQILDLPTVRKAAPLAQAFRAHRGPWADLPSLGGWAPRLLVQGQAALDALKTAAGPEMDQLFHPTLQALLQKTRKAQQGQRYRSDPYYALHVIGPLRADLPTQADGWRRCAQAVALAQPLSVVTEAIGTAKTALACLVDLQTVSVAPVRLADHPGFAVNAGPSLTDAWRAPLDAFLAEAISVKAHLDTLAKAERTAQTLVRRASGPTKTL